ncbi:MAG: DUF123 domain-containing protein [Halarsenatibacteraceae bacterium]
MEEFDFDSGIYILEIFKHKPGKVEIGALGKIAFPAGYYYYIGTAQKNLNARIKRYLAGKGNFHWHIDYFLTEANIQNVYAWPLEKEYECKIADALLELENIKVIEEGLGSSDCNCRSHLLFKEKPFEDVEEYIAGEVIA